MIIVKYRKIFYTISLIFFLVSLSALSIWGLKLGIDFKGGSLLEVSYSPSRPEMSVLKARLDSLSLGEYSLRQTGEDGYLLRMKEMSQSEKDSVIEALKYWQADGAQNKDDKLIEKRFDTIGPLLGKETAYKSIYSIVLVLLCIVLFIAFAFRHVSEPVSSWKYGIMAVIALIHDVIIPLGIFAFLGHFFGTEVDALFVTAILVVLGFSVHDTIVVFDRIRENLKLNRLLKNGKNFPEVVGDSIAQTFVRSVNTSLSTLLALVVLFFIGSEATKNFSLVLIIGIVFGTYSSIFIASNLLVSIENWQRKRALASKNSRNR